VASKFARGIKATSLLCVAVAAGFVARFALDGLIAQFPGHARMIDATGQFAVALGIVWFCLMPVLQDYGVVRRSGEK